MKVIFVGIHHKQGMRPLDSRTKTGKIVDRIITGIDDPEMEFIKTNMFDAYEIPVTAKEKASHILNWKRKYEPVMQPNIILALGYEVKRYLVVGQVFSAIRITHPAALFGTKAVDEYVSETIELIKQRKVEIYSGPF